MKDPINLEAVNLRNVDREKEIKKPSVKLDPYKINHCNKFLYFGGSEFCCSVVMAKKK